MRVALAGKGGAGKTTLSATIARTAARAGRRVVAIDADSNPNLAVALGVDAARAARAEPLPAAVASRRLDESGLAVPLEQVLAEHGMAGPDGIRVLTMGGPRHAEEGCMCAAHATVSALLTDLGRAPEVLTVVDLEASPEHLSRGTARHADVMLLVAEPYYRALETVRRLARLAAELPIARVAVVANKVRTEADAEAVAAFCQRHGLELLASVPYSAGALAADSAGAPLVDHAPDDEVVAAAGTLADLLLGAGQR